MGYLQEASRSLSEAMSKSAARLGRSVPRESSLEVAMRSSPKRRAIFEALVEAASPVLAPDSMTSLLIRTAKCPRCEYELLENTPKCPNCGSALQWK